MARGKKRGKNAIFERGLICHSSPIFPFHIYFVILRDESDDVLPQYQLLHSPSLEQHQQQLNIFLLYDALHDNSFAPFSLGERERERE